MQRMGGVAPTNVAGRREGGSRDVDLRVGRGRLHYRIGDARGRQSAGSLRLAEASLRAFGRRLVPGDEVSLPLCAWSGWLTQLLVAEGCRIRIVVQAGTCAQPDVRWPHAFGAPSAPKSSSAPSPSSPSRPSEVLP